MPSLFDAIAAGKPNKPKRASGTQSLTLHSRKSVSWAPAEQDTLHSFTLGFNVRTHYSGGGDLEIAAVAAAVGPKPAPPANHTACDSFCSSHGYKPDECHCGVCGSFGGCSFSCTADPAAHRFKCPTAEKDAVVAAHSLSIDSSTGGLSYISPAGEVHASRKVNDGAFHSIALTHYWCNGTTNVWLDGAMVGQVDGERLAPTRFALAPSDGSVDYQELFIYRSGMNGDEIKFLAAGEQVLQASLEIYAPLSKEDPTANLAQSMSTVTANL